MQRAGGRCYPRNLFALCPVSLGQEVPKTMIDHPALDTLHRMLCLHQLHAAFFANPTFCNNWQIAFDGRHRVTFHLVDAGQCRLQLGDSPTSVPLAVGDLVVIPQHRAHILAAHTELNDDDDVAEARSRVGDSTTLICGAIEVQGTHRSLLLEALPDCVVIRHQDTAEHSALRRLLELLALETHDQANACQLVLDKLAGALFAMVLRHYLHTCPPPNGIFASLNDPRLRPVLAALHADIGERWRLQRLASLANMSRSSFALHFKQMMGMPPLDYLTWWRMTHADALLRDARQSVAQVAEKLGYSTEAAFRRAFKRFFGTGPGRVRRERQLRRQPTATQRREPLESRP